jgi:hypothetical protein
MATTKPYSSPLGLAQDAKDNNTTGVENARKAFDSFAYGPSVDGTRWNKLYPYCLILAKAQSSAGGVTYNEVSRFILPIAPEQLQIQAPFAIVTTKTLGGVVEEHNGIPFKMIVASGTTGVWPLRTAQSDALSAGGLGNTGLLAGTIGAATQTSNAFNELVNGTAAAGLTGPQGADLHGTGYYQFRLLRIFLEQYAKAKRDGANAYRLLFVPFKDEVAYVVSPVLFNMRKDATNPLKYRYDLQLRAWNEVPSSSLENPSFELSTSAFDWNLGSILQKITAAQKLILSAVSMVNAFRADVQAVLNVVRQVILAVKLMVQAVIAIIDLPLQLYNDFKGMVLESWKQVESLFTGTGPGTFKGSFAAYSAGKQNATLSGRSFTNSPTLVNDAGITIDPSVLDAIFASPFTQMASEFLSTITIDKLSITPEMQKRIDTEVQRVQAFTTADFAKMRDTVQEAMVSIADTVGASDATFDATFANTHPTTTRTPNLEDFNILFAINDVVDVLNQLSTMSSSANSTANVTADYIAGIASGSGIAFQKPMSKYAVPFPYDFTLEHLSRQYLGDSDRWMEIAMLNGLREPYVDEVGFDVTFLADGKQSQIVVNSATNLEIGQPVWIQSNFVGREKRHIVNITAISQDNIILTLDGPADLAKYKVKAGAYLHAFLPDTVNSQQLIYIPSDIAVQDNSELAKVPGIDVFDDLLEIGGVDLLLTQDNDLAITNDGDCRLAYGMSAIVQRAKVALGTPRGTLFKHPTFGLPLQLGQSVADLDVKDLASACQNLFTGDTAFEGVTSVSVSQAGPAVNISLGLYVTGQDLPISLAIQVKR